MNIFKKWLAAALGAALALSLAGCTLRTPETVMAVDGTEIPAGLYLMYQYLAYSDAQTELSGTETTVKNGEIDGVAAETWVHDKTVEYVRRYIWVQQAFEAQSLALTEEEAAAAQTQAQTNYSGNQKLLEANGIGQQSYLTFYMTEIQYQKLYSAYAEEADAAVSDAEAKAYMDETYSHIRTVTLPVTDASYAALSDEDTAKITACADDLVKALNDGGDFDELVADALKTAFEICGREYGDDTLSTYSSSSFVNPDSTSYPTGMVEEIMAAKVGTANVYTAYSAPMVYQKVANYDDADEEAAFENYRSAIVSEMTLADFDAKIAGEAADYEVSENASAVKTYSVSKIKESV